MTTSAPQRPPSRRRLLLGLAALGGTALGTPPALGAPAGCKGRRGCKPAPAPGAEAGVLMAIGGNEERRGDMAVLRRFVQLSGGPRARIAVLTTASATPQLMGASYAQAFSQLGVKRRVELAIGSREDADSPAVVRRILAADGVFITGGDQQRLLAALRGSAAERALQRLHARPGSCIAGTSAGAAALSRYMLVGGPNPKQPGQELAWLEEGLSLLPGAIVDQHFSERQRLARLLSAVAQQPQLLGLGIDENTALIVERGRAIEVVGAGTVTLLDGHHLVAARTTPEPTGQPLMLTGLRRQVLAAGQRLGAPEPDAAGASWVHNAVAALVNPTGAAGPQNAAVPAAVPLPAVALAPPAVSPAPLPGPSVPHRAAGARAAGHPGVQAHALDGTRLWSVRRP
jgi:cyanophycinase